MYINKLRANARERERESARSLSLSLSQRWRERPIGRARKEKKKRKAEEKQAKNKESGSRAPGLDVGHLTTRTQPRAAQQQQDERTRPRETETAREKEKGTNIEQVRGGTKREREKGRIVYGRDQSIIHSPSQIREINTDRYTVISAPTDTHTSEVIWHPDVHPPSVASETAPIRFRAQKNKHMLTASRGQAKKLQKSCKKKLAKHACIYHDKSAYTNTLRLTDSHILMSVHRRPSTYVAYSLRQFKLTDIQTSEVVWLT